MNEYSFDKHIMLATCARGFESYLCSELEHLGAQKTHLCGGGVQFEASFKLAMNLCLWSRIANKIEVFLGDCYAVNDQAIYDLGKSLPLDPWFHPTKTFCVHAHSSDPKFKNALFLSLKLKDGIVDHMRQAWGQRASIDTERPDIEISLTVAQRRARVHIELQGNPLNMRGYRQRQMQAPIRETLAASMLAVSDYRHDETAFFDPMCGSGTFAIEAALKATQTAPGIQRHFAFEKLPFFADFQKVWNDLRAQAREISRNARKNFHAEIHALDIDTQALDIAQNNAQTAGVADLIHFSQADVLDFNTTDSTIITNPPYGERISVSGYDLPEFYYQLGRNIRNCKNSSLTIISSTQLLKKNLHMRPELRISTYNGPLECEVARYALGQGLIKHGEK